MVKGGAGLAKPSKRNFLAFEIEQLATVGRFQIFDHIEQLQPIAVGAPLHFSCHLEPLRVTDKGWPVLNAVVADLAA